MRALPHPYKLVLFVLLASLGFALAASRIAEGVWLNASINLLFAVFFAARAVEQLDD